MSWLVFMYAVKKKRICPEPWRSIRPVLVSGWLKLWACACRIVCSNCLNYYYKEYICETIVCPKKKGYRESAAICNNVTTIFTFFRF